MKKHSVSSRLLCLLLVFFCMAQVAFAEEVPTETRYVAVDGPSANIDLAFGSGVGLAAVAAVDVGEIRVGAAHLPDAGVHLFYKGFRVAGHPFRQNDAGVTGVGQHNAV